LPRFAPSTWGADPGSAQPDAAELDLAALGARLRQEMPEIAAQLEATARQAVNIALEATIDWEGARRAQIQLTKPEVVAAEFAEGEAVFVDGWPLAYSEAGIALLFSAAGIESGTAPQTALSE